MSKTTLSAKGQVVIPRAVRERHAWGAGTEFSVEDQGNVIVLRPIGLGPSAAVESLLGCTGYHGPPKSLEDMDDGIARGARRTR